MWAKQIDGAAESYHTNAIRKDLLAKRVNDFDISGELQTQLRDRLSPFYFREHVVDSVFSGNDPDYPQTKTECILTSLKRQVREVVFFKSEDVDRALWAGTELGYATQETCDKLSKVGLRIVEEEENTATVTNRLFRDISAFDVSVLLPTLSHVTKSNLFGYAERTYEDWSIPTLVITGDSLSDYCFYQATSRMRYRVVWLPPWIREHLKKMQQNNGAEGSGDAFLFINSLHSMTRYSDTYNGNVLITSTTLGAEELRTLQEGLQKYGMRPFDWKVVAVAEFLKLLLSDFTKRTMHLCFHWRQVMIAQ